MLACGFHVLCQSAISTGLDTALMYKDEGTISWQNRATPSDPGKRSQAEGSPGYRRALKDLN